MINEKRRKRVSVKTLVIVWILSTVLLVGGTVGVTLAWLTAESTPVRNTFTESDINITLSETKPENNTAPMIPGCTIDKDPKVRVVEGSEDCWLFVKITESTTPDLDNYICYEIADKYDATEKPHGWQIVQDENENGEIVIGRKVYKDDAIKEFSILGAGKYTDPMNPNDENDNCQIIWNENQVCVKPSVTEDMMTNITGEGKTKPTLTFQAYAVQLFKTNSDGNKADTGDEFTEDEAWARATGLNSSN